MLTPGCCRDGGRGRVVLLLAISSLAAALAGISRLNGEAGDAGENGQAIDDEGVPVEIAIANRSDLVRSIAAGCEVIGSSRSGDVHLIAEVPAHQAGRIARGAEAELTFPSCSAESWRGEISRLDAVTGNGQEGMSVAITLRGGTSLPAGVTRGMSGTIAVRTETAVALLVVPREAVLHGGGRTSVFLCRSGRVITVPVVTGLWNETFTEILSGLREGDTVITRAHRPVSGGSKIRIMDEHGAVPIVVRTTHAQRTRIPSPLEAEEKPDFISSLFMERD